LFARKTRETATDARNLNFRAKTGFSVDSELAVKQRRRETNRNSGQKKEKTNIKRKETSVKQKSQECETNNCTMWTKYLSHRFKFQSKLSLFLLVSNFGKRAKRDKAGAAAAAILSDKGAQNGCVMNTSPSVDEILSKLAPAKSAVRYERAWASFMDFLESGKGPEEEEFGEEDPGPVEEQGDINVITLEEEQGGHEGDVGHEGNVGHEGDVGHESVGHESDVGQEGEVGHQEKGRGQVEERTPTQDDYIKYLHYLHEVKKFKSSTMWSMYSRLNNVHQRKFGVRLQVIQSKTYFLRSRMSEILMDWLETRACVY
jgi:hypothetical protein